MHKLIIMKRKVMRIGPATHVVSLPSEWIFSHGVKKGDTLDVDTIGSSLRISLPAEKERTASCNVSYSPPVLNRIIASLYQAGFDELKLYFDTGKKTYTQKYYINKYTEISLIKRSIDMLSGMDLSEISRDSKGDFAVIKQRSAPMHDHFNVTFEQIFSHIISMADEILDSIEKKNKRKLEKTLFTDVLINQTADFCLRILNTKGYDDPCKASSIHVIVRQLEHIGDRYREIYTLYGEGNFNVGSDVIKMLRDVNSIVKDFYNIFKIFEIKELEKFLLKLINMSHRLNETSGKTNKGERDIIFRLYYITQQIFDLVDTLMVLKHEKFLS